MCATLVRKVVFSSAFALGLAALVALSAQAGTPAVQVADKAGYTNLTFTVQVSSAGNYKIVAKDIATGATAGTAVLESALAAGSNVVDVPIDRFTGGAGVAVGKTYAYEVQSADGATTVGVATFSNVGWMTNGYFSASAKTGSGVYNNGAWVGTAPEISNSKFAIDSTQQVFRIATVRQSDTRQIVVFEAELDIEEFYFMDDVTNDVCSAIAAFSLVTNEEDSSVCWMVLAEGDKWTKITSGATKTNGAYTTRVELDYNTTPARVRYSVKPEATGVWEVLSTADGEWFDAETATDPVSNVCFIGRAVVAGFEAELSTKGVAEVNSSDYLDIASALAAAGSGRIVLYTNIQVDPRTLGEGSYSFNLNGKTFTANEVEWKASDGAKTELVWDGESLTVVKSAFVAAIGDAVYTKLGDAFLAAEDKTVVVLTNIAENATSTVANAVLDLGGYTVTKGTADRPIVTVSGGEASLYVFGGAITGATDIALCVTNGASLYLADLFVTNNAGYAIHAAKESVVEVSNGWFQANGAIKAIVDTSTPANSGKIYLLGGYFVDGSTFEGLDGTGFGGKFTANSATSEVRSGLAASGYKFAEFAVPFTTNGVTVGYEIMTNVYSGSTSLDTKVWSVTDDDGKASIGGVQLTDVFVASAVKGTSASTPAEKQTELNQPSGYAGVKKWECYVLGMTNAVSSATSTTVGPYVKGVQDANAGKIGFRVLTPTAIRAVESGCDVKYEIEEYTDPSLSESSATGKTTGRVDYDKTAELAAPGKTDGVRYYKLKLYIAPKN